MAMTLLVVAAGLAVAGFAGYRKLQTIEREIRDELDVERRVQPESEDPVPLKEESAEVTVATSQPVKESLPSDLPGSLSLEEGILAIVSKTPGLLQTAIYGEFPEVDRKTLQAALLGMSKAGTIERKKKGSSYQLFCS